MTEKALHYYNLSSTLQTYFVYSPKSVTSPKILLKKWITCPWPRPYVG